MRVFVFAIGGTGARVLSAIIMQLAAGVAPKDPSGAPIADLSIVPILLDPHETNDAVQQTKQVLESYRTMRNKIYGTRTPPPGKFFSVKVETLKDISQDQGNATEDVFYFKLQRVSDSKFSNFVGLSAMSRENKLFSQMLFSPGELNTEMHIGFTGSPNIGSIALGEFKKSDVYNTFCSAYREGDKLFFIGSVFGGTGAAGLPHFITSIRDLNHVENKDTGKTNCSKAAIGALIVMPYFNIKYDENSTVNSTEFSIKTRSALRYYSKNLNAYINSIYYIDDPQRTADFINDPGENEQNGNKAHMVEFAGAQALFHFIASTNTEVKEVANKKDESESKRLEVKQTEYLRFLFPGCEKIDFRTIGENDNAPYLFPMMKFYLLQHFMQHHLAALLDKPFAKKYTPRIESNLMLGELKIIFNVFNRMMNEMQSHGSGAHNLQLFLPPHEDDYSNAFVGIKTRKAFIGSKRISVRTIQQALDTAAPKHTDLNSPSARWFAIANEALEEILHDNYDFSTL